MANYTFYTSPTAYVQMQFDPSTSLANVRASLGTFVTSNHRFLNYQTSSTYYTDMIIGTGNEAYIPISSVVGVLNQVYLTDVNAVKNADLIGFKTPWFWDRLLGFQISMNQESAAQAINRGKMQPIMLTNVKMANPNLRGAGAMDNVLICQRDTVIQFTLNSWGAAAYGYDIRPLSGTPITEYPLYICFSSCSPNNRSLGGLQKYYSQSNPGVNGKMIQIVPTSSITLSNGTALSYMKFTVKTWIVTAFTPEHGSVIACNAPIPSPTPGTGRSAGISSGTTIPSTTTSGQVFNGSINNIQENKGPAGILGEIVFYAFVFDSESEANATFQGMNTPLNSLWIV